MYEQTWYLELDNVFSLSDLADLLEGQASLLREMHKAGVEFNGETDFGVRLSCDDEIVANYYKFNPQYVKA